MDMLHQGNKLFIVLIAILLLLSCNNYKKYNEKEIVNTRKRTLTISQNMLDRETYSAIYKMANDSIINWSKNGLGKWKYFGNLTDYQLDSVFCINKEENKIIFSILRRTMIEGADGDGISLKDLIWFYFVNTTKKIFIHH
jgi:hypothetical protein